MRALPLPASPTPPRPRAPGGLRYVHGALAASVLLGILSWFVVSISGDMHYSLEQRHHDLETGILALLSAQIGLVAWEALRRVPRLRG